MRTICGEGRKGDLTRANTDVITEQRRHIQISVTSHMPKIVRFGQI